VDGGQDAVVWPTGADIDLGVLYDWCEHVNAIVQRRTRRFGAEMPVLVSAA
jgi:hypothetical protein